MKHSTFRPGRIAGVALAMICAVALFSTTALADSHMKPGKGKTVRPVWGQIAEEWFQNEVIFIGLRDLGYKVNTPLEVEIPAAYLSVGNGDADFYAIAWEPLQDKYYNQSGGGKTAERIGEVYDGALQGYLIDKKTAEKYNITNLDQLKDPKIAKLFDTNGDGKADLTGCNPGWGCERVIEHQMKEYGLEPYVKHNQGSYFALIADTITRFKRGEPILYYTWTPLWVSGILVPGKDTVWLNVPYTSLPGERTDTNTTLPDGTNVGFAVNKCRIYANNEFLKENPAAAKFLELVRVPINDIMVENAKMQKDENKMADIQRHAKEWVKAHRAEFDTWLDAARKAAE